MEKKTACIVAFHALAIAGIGAGYAYLICQNKKQTKIDLKSMNNIN